MRAAGIGERLGVIASRGGGGAELWCARVGPHLGQLDRFSAEVLSGEERERLSRYRSRDAAERYVLTRALVRLVLSERLRLDPRNVVVTRTDTGKPIVSGGVNFNVSHSGDLILLAVSTERPIGVDVERRRDVPRVDALVARWLSPEEQHDVADRVHRGASPSESFLRVWSLKEARLKALGVGISGQSRAAAELRRIEVHSLDALFEPVNASDYVGAIAFA